MNVADLDPVKAAIQTQRRANFETFLNMLDVRNDPGEEKGSAPKLEAETSKPFPVKQFPVDELSRANDDRGMELSTVVALGTGFLLLSIAVYVIASYRMQRQTNVGTSDAI